MGFICDVAIGAAVIILPQKGLPVLALTTCVQLAKHVKRKRQDRLAEADSAPVLRDVPPATLTFSGITCSIAPTPKDAKQGATAKLILDDIAGSAKPGRLLALMGPSGSGKTSLLNALANRVPVTKRMTLAGLVRVNGRRPAAANVRIGYVPQEDMFYSQMTVRETLDMTAALRLPRSLTQAERDAAVAGVMAQLDLAAVADAVVGDKKTRGLSGGEKKRLSIACELLNCPSLLFLDEPTTGLDAFQALKVMEALKQLAQAGHTVVAAVHQPRSLIYELFDDLLLLSKGRMVYAGAAAAALTHFDALGHKCPEHHNPAEFLADLISLDNSNPAAAQASAQRLDGLVAAAPAADVGALDDDGAPAAGKPPNLHHKPPLPVQLRLLMKRSWRQVTRDRAAIRLRLATNIQSGVVFGCIWWRLRRLQQSVSSRLGLLQVVAVYMSQSALFKTLNLFPPEKNLVTAERAKGSYDVLPYFFSKVFAELPVAVLFPTVFSLVVYPMTNLQPTLPKLAAFVSSNVLETLSSTAMGMAIGAVAPSTEAALVLGPAIMLVFIVFGGLYTNQSDVPRVLRWAPDTSQIKTGYDALCKNELSGLQLEREGLVGGFGTGDEVLKRQGFTGTVASSILHQGRILMFHWWLTYCILKAKKPQWQVMDEPAPVDAIA